MTGPLTRGLVVSAVAALLAAVTPASADPRGDLAITMQEQEKSQWCWDASGNTIAAFWGHEMTQNEFCRVAHEKTETDCPDEIGYLSDLQRVYQHLKFRNPGTYDSAGKVLSFAEVKAEIDAKRPLSTRIAWPNAGGHMHVVYGYDEASGVRKVSYGDPWKDYARYNSMDYDAYVKNDGFQWTHTIYGIEG